MCRCLPLCPKRNGFAIIDGIIEQVRVDEEEARLAEQQAMQDMAYNQTMIYNSNQTGGPSRSNRGAHGIFIT